jgi:hypothetical protein
LPNGVVHKKKIPLLLSAHEITEEVNPLHNANTPSLSKLLSDHPIMSHMPANKANAQANLG